MKTYKVADIFSGCGGFTLGFHGHRSFEVTHAVDHWGTALATLKHNQPNVDCLEADLSNPLEVRRLADTLSGTDVMLGGPPCQGFSTLGKRRDGDSRSTLVDVFANLVLRVKPAVVLVENVRGITTKKHPEFTTYAEALIKRLGGNGSGPYRCSSMLLNAVDFGVAQSRIRWFLVAVRTDLVDANDDLSSLWKNAAKANVVATSTVADAIGELPEVSAGQTVTSLADGMPLYNHRAMGHSTELLSRLECIPEKGGLLDVPRNLLTPHLCKMVDGGYGSGGHVKNIYGRLDWHQPSGTIVAGIDKITCGRFVHPVQNRLLTPRECARLQSFPDNFEFLGGQVAQYYQVGNAVPPRLAAALADSVDKTLRGINRRAGKAVSAGSRRAAA